MNNKYLAKNDFFIAYVGSLYETKNRIDAFVCVIRRDTYETYESFSLYEPNKKLWSSIANDFIKKLNKPEDWKRSHRYCLARYARQVLIKDNFIHNLDKNLSVLQKSYHSIMLSNQKDGTITKKKQSNENKSLIVIDELSTQTATLKEFRKPYYSTSIESDQQEIEEDHYEEDNITFDEKCSFFQYINHYITVSHLIDAVLIKKLNQLSFEEKCQLFILKDWEWESRAFEDVHCAIFGREYVYKRLYDKRRFTTHYKEFRERLNYLQPNYWPDEWEDGWEDE